MTFMLGVDTGGTYTDAVIIDEARDLVLAKAKALTSRPDLAVGVAGAIDAAIAAAGVDVAQIGLVSLSTTLATNALVEGQGGKVALVFIGFTQADLGRAGLADALGGDPVIMISGGHDHAGHEVSPLDLESLEAQISTLDDGVTGFAVAAAFATRNPAHEAAVRDLLRRETGKPVTCSHELSQGLGGPKRALTAVLNARLIGMIDGLISACESHLAKRGIAARMMVVRGDGALVTATVAREKPIETILSGPAASIAGASWLTGVATGLVSDIGGTTSDICLLRNGRPQIDTQGARVGKYRTMVEAVAMRTSGLGGDSQVHLNDGIDGGVTLGPRRVMPVSLMASQYPALVHDVLDRALAKDGPALDGAQFVLPIWETGAMPSGLDKREAAIVARLANGPARMGHVVTTRIEMPALDRLIARGHVMVTGITPSDASHVLGHGTDWDGSAAEKALSLFARRRNGAGERLASDAVSLARMIIDQMTRQTVTCLLEAAFAEDDRHWNETPASDLARHPLTEAGLDGHADIIKTQLSFGVPVIGLGASAHVYYGAVGDRLGTQMIVPDHAGVANAIGAVVGQVAMQQSASVTSSGPGRFVAHLSDGPSVFQTADAALVATQEHLRDLVTHQALRAGVDTPNVTLRTDVQDAEIEGSQMFVSAEITARATGRPRIAD